MTNHLRCPLPPRSALALALALTAAGPHARAGTADPLRTPAATPDSSIATIILVRHAERDTTAGPDYPLTAAGERRAQELARTLGGSGISAIYVTRWQRTRRTALPLATAIGESLTVLNEVAETVRRLRASHFGQTVLVVGHSNTLPDIVTAITGRPFPTAGEAAYDGMWVVTLPRVGRASLLALRYGAPVEDAPAPASPARH